MPSRAVVEVLESMHSDWSPGDRALAAPGWQTAAVLDGADLASIDPSLAASGLPDSYALGVLGTSGLTAYVGLHEIGRPQPGETVVVAAAAGPVGSAVGQLARRLGARVVGIAGGEEKGRILREQFGFDAVVDHRSPEFEAELAAACPDGIDFDFENVGGRVFSAVLPLLNRHGRVAVCGLVSQHQGTEGMPDAGALLRACLDRSLSIQGFLVHDFVGKYRERFFAEVPALVAGGEIAVREHRGRGFDAIIPTFIDMLAGRTLGKTIVEF
jgi:NADPH-dependent curcumin reductase CurA